MHSNKILGLYHKQEIIVHELSHVGRMMFEEPKYEEHLAYMNSPSFLRRLIGPFFQSSYESIAFILFLLFLIAWDLFALFTGFSFGLELSFYFKGVLLLMIPMGCLRLLYRQNKIAKCVKKLSSITSDPNHVLYRLTDREIDGFSSLSTEEIIDYAKKESGKSLRWKIISNYFSEG